jgi:hypothetical protein
LLKTLLSGTYPRHPAGDDEHEHVGRHPKAEEPQGTWVASDTCTNTAADVSCATSSGCMA